MFKRDSLKTFSSSTAYEKFFICTDIAWHVGLLNISKHSSLLPIKISKGGNVHAIFQTIAKCSSHEAHAPFSGVNF